MRSTVLAPLVIVFALGGCSLSRAGLLDAQAPPGLSAPVRAYFDTSKDSIARRDLAPLFPEETRYAGAATVDRHALSLAVPVPVAAPLIEEADPIRGTFDALPEGHRWMPDEFLPSGGTLDVTRLGRGRLHVRAWNQDEDFRGGGLGVTVPLRSGWHASTEIGVDPGRRPDAGGVAIVVGFGLRL